MFPSMRHEGPSSCRHIRSVFRHHAQVPLITERMGIQKSYRSHCRRSLWTSFLPRPRQPRNPGRCQPMCPGSTHS